ncbi:MAG TPA: 50S ribosomal protein L20 [Chlamydiales bacterium]|nr:50S ribosomal protein L20 [Chlamydiales bacterium]
MVRVTSAVARHKRKKRLNKRSKGFFGDRKNHLKLTKDAVMKADAYNYMHRKKKKGDFRRIWIVRIGVGAKMNGISYSKFIDGLKKAKCEINRKVLSELAIHDPRAFSEVASVAKAAFVA